MLSRLTSRPRLALAVLALALAGFATLFAVHAMKATADYADNTTCWGKIEKGTPDPDDPSVLGIKYTIQCNGKINGYSITTAPEREVLGAETEVFVTNGKGDVVGSDAFSCNGAYPGWGINCVSPAGSDYKTPGNFITGEFFVEKNRCANPRLDPILTVSYATVNAKNQAVQSMAGPFDLGHAVDCPKPTSYRAGRYTKRKIPYEQDQVLSGQEDRRRK